MSKVTSPGSTPTSTEAVELGYETSGTGHTGLVTSDTNPQGNCTAYTYDTAGNMLASYEGLSGGTGSTCSSQTNSYGYTNTYQDQTGTTCTGHTGLPGELCSTTTPKGNATKYEYYANGNLKTVIPPSPQGKTSYTYDTVNRPITITTPTGTLHITYDGDNRITKLAYTSGPTITYTYDGDGNVTQRVDPTGTTKFKYNTLNEMIRETLPSTADACSGDAYMKLAYNNAGYLASFCDAGGTTKYTYNAANELTTLTEPSGNCTPTHSSLCVTFGYDTTGKRTDTTFPGGATMDITYDTAGQEKLITSKSSSGTVLTKYTYTYKKTTKSTSLIQKLVESEPTSATTTYGYDAREQLTSAATTGGPTYDYAYNSDGNRCSVTTSCSSPTYSYNADTELTSTSTGSYSYNGSGEETASPQLSALTYNTADQTISFTPAGGTKATLAYAETGQFLLVKDGSTTLANGPLGLDQIKTGGKTTYLIRDPTGNPIAENVVTSTVVHRYYFLKNSIGSVTAVVNGAGSTVSDRFTYDPYGNITASSGSVYDPIRYAGGYYEASSKLTKFGARYYDPLTGRWTQENPIGGSISRPADLNGFAYGNDDPVNLTDPSGETVTIRRLCFVVALGVANACAYFGSPAGTAGFTVPPGYLQPFEAPATTPLNEEEITLAAVTPESIETILIYISLL